MGSIIHTIHVNDEDIEDKLNDLDVKEGDKIEVIFDNGYSTLYEVVNSWDERHKPKLITPCEPRYDDVFEEGIKSLT